MSEGVLQFFFIVTGAILTLIFFPLLAAGLYKNLRRWHRERNRH